MSILSSGIRTPMTPFIKKYPYSKLGIYCKLKNDMFTLRGTAEEGSSRYLIKRGFLRGINVINHNPDIRIPWKNMVNRIRAIIDQGAEKPRFEVKS